MPNVIGWQATRPSQKGARQMTGNPRKTGFGLVGLLIASLVVVAPQPTEAHRQDAPRDAKPDVGTVRGTLVYRFG